jgi:nitroreductase
MLKEKVIKEALGIPEEIRVVAMTPLGYPAEDLPPVSTKKRRAVEEIFCESNAIRHSNG